MGTTLDQCTQSQRTPVEPAYKTHQTSDLAEGYTHLTL